MINIVIPMAGLGSRFSKSGYSVPKPLIEIGNKTMIETVINNLTPDRQHKFIFICQIQHERQFNISSLLKKYTKNCNIVFIDGLTDGAACTVLEAQKYFNNDSPMMIANCDQYIDFDINNYLDEWLESDKDGYIMTMKANDPKWSYIGVDKNNEVYKVIEKEVISDEATVGIYNFKMGRDFIKAAEKMIKKNDRVNNEFYVAPVYNYMIENKLKVGYFNIGSVGKGMHGLGTPEDLEDFLNNFKI